MKKHERTAQGGFQAEEKAPSFPHPGLCRQRQKLDKDQGNLY